MGGTHPCGAKHTRLTCPGYRHRMCLVPVTVPIGTVTTRVGNYADTKPQLLGNCATADTAGPDLVVALIPMLAH